MNIYHTLMPHDVIHNKEMEINTVVLCLDNGNILTCTKFNHPKNQKLELLVWLNKKEQWIKTYLKNNATELMWEYYRKHVEKTKKRHRVDYDQLMQPYCSGKNFKGKKIPVQLPQNVNWSVQRPLQGGCFSPK